MRVCLEDYSQAKKYLVIEELERSKRPLIEELTNNPTILRNENNVSIFETSIETITARFVITGQTKWDSYTAEFYIMFYDDFPYVTFFEGITTKITPLKFYHELASREKETIKRKTKALFKLAKAGKFVSTIYDNRGFLITLNDYRDEVINEITTLTALLYNIG